MLLKLCVVYCARSAFVVERDEERFCRVLIEPGVESKEDVFNGGGGRQKRLRCTVSAR